MRPATHTRPRKPITTRLMCITLPSRRLVNDAYLAIPAPSLAPAAPCGNARFRAVYRRPLQGYARRRNGERNIWRARGARQMWSESTFVPNDRWAGCPGPQRTAAQATGKKKGRARDPLSQ